MRAVVILGVMVLAGVAQARPFHNHAKFSDEVESFLVLWVLGIICGATMVGISAVRRSFRHRSER